MTRLSDAELKSDNARIAELQIELASILEVKAARIAEEKEYRAKEDKALHITHAAKIFELKHDQLRLEVEAEFVRKKILRLQLGYAEDAMPMNDTPKGFVL